MHFFDSTSPSAPARLVRLAVCTLLPAFIQDAAAVGVHRSFFDRSVTMLIPSRPRTIPAPIPVPYLLVCLPPPLRFTEPVEPADPVSGLPTALGPPHPGGILEEIAALNHQAAMTGPALDGTHGSSPPEKTDALTATSSVAVPPVTPGESSGPASIQPAPPQIGVAILPDNTTRTIRAEDVLVYFQLPASAPTNNTPPRSSATYQQQ